MFLQKARRSKSQITTERPEKQIDYLQCAVIQVSMDKLVKSVQNSNQIQMREVVAVEEISLADRRQWGNKPKEIPNPRSPKDKNPTATI
jgi:hypothetical protein